LAESSELKLEEGSSEQKVDWPEKPMDELNSGEAER
jgi:hypothetical protein